MAGKTYVIKDNSGVEFFSNGNAKIGGLTVNMRKPEKLNVLNTTIDLFRHTPIPVTNSVYNRIGYGIVASQNTGGEVLYPIQKLRDGVQPTDTNDNRFNYDMYSIRKNEGVKLQGCYLVRDTNGRVAWIRGKNNKNSNITPPNGASPSDYVFSIDGTGRAVNTKTKETTTWGYELIKKENNDGTKSNNSTKPKAIQGMPSNFSSNANNVKILQQYLVRMGEQKNIATTKVPSGIDGIYGRRTEAATKRIMEAQKWTWDQLWAQAVQYAKQMSGQDNHMVRVDQTTAQVNPEAAEFANPQKLTAQTQGITQQAQPASTAKYAANASNVLQPKQAVAESAENEDKETVEEIKNTFYDIFNRMNNATILQ